MFTSGTYIKKNPEAVKRLSQGNSVDKNQNFVFIWDKKLNALRTETGEKAIMGNFIAYKDIFDTWIKEEKKHQGLISFLTSATKRKEQPRAVSPATIHNTHYNGER